MRPWAGSWSRVFRLLLVSMVGLGFATQAGAQSNRVLVFAAASLKTALDDVNRAWQRDTGKSATIVYAASNLLAKQIEAGAPADMFLSADLDWMNYAASRGLVRVADRVDLFANSLVMIAPSGSRTERSSGPGFDVGAAIGSGRLAIGNVDAVPAGKYGKAALRHLGYWDTVKDRLAQGESARAALVLVSLGEAPLGLVFRTDAASDPGVKVVFDIPSESHPPIVYPAALTAVSSHPDAATFLAFLRSESVKPLFERQGFIVLNRPVPRS